MGKRQRYLWPISQRDMQCQIARRLGQVKLEPALKGKAKAMHDIGSLDMRRAMHSAPGPTDPQRRCAGPANDARHAVGAPNPLHMAKPPPVMARQRKAR